MECTHAYGRILIQFGILMNHKYTCASIVNIPRYGMPRLVCKFQEHIHTDMFRNVKRVYFEHHALTPIYRMGVLLRGVNWRRIPIVKNICLLSETGTAPPPPPPPHPPTPNYDLLNPNMVYTTNECDDMTMY